MKNNVKTLSLFLGLASLALGQTTTAPIYTVSIFAGIPTPNSLGDNGQSVFATVSDPDGVAVDANGNVFVSDNNNNRIRRIDAVTGIITTYASSGISSPVALTFDHEGNLWVSQTGNNNQIVKITPPAKAGAAVATSCTVTATGTTGTCVMVSINNATGTYGSDGDYAYNAWLNSVGQIAFDANDDLFIADTSNNRIRLVRNSNNCMNTPILTGNNTMNESCRIITIAGATNGSTAGTPQFGTSCGTNNTCTPAGTNTVGDGGPALAARVSGPAGIAVTPDGNTVYFSEITNQRIRTINMLTGKISTLIGNCTDAAAKVGNFGNNSAPAVITCPAGSFGSATANGTNASVSSLGDGKVSTQATVSTPRGLYLDPVANILYFADASNSRIRTIDLSSGIVNTVIGGGSSTNDTGNGSSSSLNGGLLTSLSLSTPYAVWVQNGLIYWVETASDKVRLADPVAQVAKTMTRVPRSSGSGGPATNAYLGFNTTFASTQSPRVAVDGAGNVYVVEATTNRVRQVNSQGIINEWAGTGGAASSTKTNGDTGPAVVSQLSSPQSVAFDSNGNGYIADTGINRIRMVSAAGVISTVVGRNSVTTCSTAASKAGTCAVDKSDYVGDGGPALSAVLTSPQGIAVDSKNNLIIADTGHHSIRYVNMTTNVITTIGGGVPATDPVTGGPLPGGPTDGRSALGSSGYQDSTDAAYGLLNAPRGVAVDASGNIYIADYANSAARELIPTNLAKGSYQLTTFYGSNSSSGTAPGIPTGTAAASIPARIRITTNNQTSVAVDTGGNIYFALANDGRVNVVSADHTKVFIVAGGGAVGADTGLNYTSGNAVNIELPNVSGVAVDSNGNVYTADRTGLVKKMVCSKNCLPLK